MFIFETTNVINNPTTKNDAAKPNEKPGYRGIARYIK